MAIRAKELAKELGVSEATISLVINGKPGISDKTRRRVERQISELGYGELLQKAERNETGKTIGFVLFKRSGELLGENSFFPLIIDSVTGASREKGYNLTIVNVEREHISEQARYISESGCNGFVIFATEMQEEDIVFFEELRIPFVIFDNEFPGSDYNCVKVNNKQGIFLAVKNLVENGHRNIGYLSSGLDINSFKERRQCYINALEFMGVEYGNKYVYDIGYPNEAAEIGMKKILENKDRSELPTAFLADNDLVAAGALRAIQDKGYSVPDDFSIIGFDDRPICTLTTPKLTTVQLPRPVFGRMAVDQLIHVMRHGSGNEITVEINGRLIERETVRTLK